MKLNEKGQRTVKLTRSQLERIQSEADSSYGWARGHERTSARKIEEIAEQALRGAGNGLLYQLHISLKGSKPPIWRRIQVQDCTLQQLHWHIQAVMGWYDSHLHEFEIEGVRFSSPSPLDFGFGEDLDAEDDSQVFLGQLVPAGVKNYRFTYLYDFGDCWEHEIKVEDVISPDAKTRYPICVKGKRACPPEDCGGMWGYYDFVAAITDANHEQHEEMMEWHGPYDPEEFDPKRGTKDMHQWARL